MPRAARVCDRTPADLEKVAELLESVHQAVHELLAARDDLQLVLSKAKTAGATWDELTAATGFARTTLRNWTSRPRHLRPTTLLHHCGHAVLGIAS